MKLNLDVFDLVATIRLNADAFNQGLDAAKTKAKSFASGLESTSSGIGGVKDVLSTAAQGFQKVESVGKTAGKAIMTGLKGFTAASAVVGAFGKSAVNSGMEFDATMSEVSAISGAVGQDFQDLRNKALEMGAKTKFSASEAAEAMTYMGMAGWKTQDMLSGISGIMNLAAASGEDLATTSDIVTDALTAFGVSADGASMLADIMAAAATNANTNVGMMGDTFKYVAPVAGSLGYTMGETAAVIGLMANAGIKSSQAGTSLRSIMTRLATDAGASSQSLGALGTLTQKLGVEFYNTDGSARQLLDVINDSREAWKGLSDEEAVSYAKIIAGQEAMSGWLAIMNAADEDVNKLTMAIVNCNGAAEEMSKTMVDNLQGDLTLLGSAFESLKIAISDGLTPTLREFAQFGQKAMAGLLEGFQGNGVTGFMDALQGIVTDGAKMLAKKAPDFFHIGKSLIINILEGLIGAKDEIFDAANKIMMDFTSTFVTIPLHYGEDLRDIGGRIIELIVTGFTRAGGFIADYIGDFIPLIVEGFLAYHETLFTVGLEILGAIGRGIIEHKGEIRKIATETIARMTLALIQHAPEIVHGAIALLEALVDAIALNMPLITAAGAEIIALLIEGIATASPGVQAIIATAVVPKLLSIVSTASKIGSAVGSVIKLIGSGISSVGSVISGVVSLVSKGISGVVSVGKTLITGIQALWGLLMANPIALVVAAIAALVAGFVLLWNNCEGFREFWIGLWEGCKEALSKFADWVGEKAAEIVEWFKEKWNGITEFFSEIFEGIKEAFSAFGDWVSEKMSEIVEWAKEKWDGFKEFFSQLWEDVKEVFSAVGEFFSEKFAAAVDAIKNAWSSVTEFFSGIWDDIKNVFATVKETLSGFFSAAWDAIKSAWGATKEFFSGVWDGIKGVFSTVSEVLGGFFRDAWSAVKTAWEAAGEFFNKLGEGIRLVFEGVTEAISGFFSEAWEAVKLAWDSAVTFFIGVWDGISGAFSDVASFFSRVFTDAWNGITSVWSDVKGFFSGVWGDIKDVFSGALEHFRDVGKNILTGIWNGISDKIAWLKGKVTGVVDTIKGWFTGKKGFDEHSPSKWSRQVFRYVMDGGVEGLDDGTSQLMKEIRTITDRVKNGMDFGTATVGLSTSGLRTGNGAFGIPDNNLQGGNTFNFTFNSPKALNAVEAAREAKKSAQMMAMGYV